MGSISIFDLQFSGVKFAVSRDLLSGYRLEAGDFVVSMTPDAAAALAEGGARVRLKAQIAAHFRREMKSGATFRRDMLAVDGRTVRIEIGVSDAGDSVYLEVGAEFWRSAGTARVSNTHPGRRWGRVDLTWPPRQHPRSPSRPPPTWSLST
jgi:hypothetical protein